ncbi:hypothetical protein BHE74_00050052 [Ensete ventricosum]|nr:hypothetical protein BHE74_00050052 [Ensete ventricosum]
MVINITRSRVESRISIAFTCTISKIQNTGHSRGISPCMVSRKNATVINFMQSRVSISFSCTVWEIQNTGNSQRISP